MRPDRVHTHTHSLVVVVVHAIASMSVCASECVIVVNEWWGKQYRLALVFEAAKLQKKICIMVSNGTGEN